MRAYTVLIAGLAFALFGGSPATAQTPIRIVAAQNFYGDIARQIGGANVVVTDVPMAPGQDPHLFEPSPAIARQIADAQVVIINGAHYDAWAEKQLKASRKAGRIVINAAQLTGKKEGDNPHLWYDPQTMPAVARALTDALSKADAAHAADYKAGLDATLAKLAAIDKRIAEIKSKHAGKPVTATEPVFGLMVTALGLVSRNDRFQRAIMNETEPAASDLAAFESDLKSRKVAALIYNKQVDAKLARQLVSLAEQSKVPIVAVTETMPSNVTYIDWVLGELDALDKALSNPTP